MGKQNTTYITALNSLSLCAMHILWSKTRVCSILNTSNLSRKVVSAYRYFVSLPTLRNDYDSRSEDVFYCYGSMYVQYQVTIPGTAVRSCQFRTHNLGSLESNVKRNRADVPFPMGGGPWTFQASSFG